MNTGHAKKAHLCLRDKKKKKREKNPIFFYISACYRVTGYTVARHDALH